MKVPKAQVPAELWAEKAERNIAGLDAAQRACLEAWQGSRQVFKVNEALWRELEEMDLDEIPVGALEHLPYPCLYLQHEWETRQTMPNGSSDITTVTKHAGMFCWVKDGHLYMGDHVMSMAAASRNGRSVRDSNSQNTILVAVFDLSEENSIKKFIEDGIRSYKADIEKALKAIQLTRSRVPNISKTVDEVAREYEKGVMFAPAVAALMYIASKNADLSCVYQPAAGLPKKSRQSRSTITEVGYRIAPKLREMRSVEERGGESSAREGHRSPAPHIRRAHWHGYWTGPRDNPTGLDIKWIAPVLVNAPQAEVSGVVHEVGKDEDDLMDSLVAAATGGAAYLDKGTEGELTLETR